MKLVILAGGLQSAISSEKEGIPKPMVDLGGKPLLWHIMKTYASWGIDEFIICGGYKVSQIKEYFQDYYIYQSDVTIDLATNQITIHKKKTENWTVTVVDTGIYSSTGQRIAQIEKFIDEDNFIVAYGDCLTDLNLRDFIQFHKTKNKIGTVAVAKPSGRNKILSIKETQILGKGMDTVIDAWVNACIYVFKKEVFRYLQGNYELDYFVSGCLADHKEIAVYKHEGFWRPVETQRDRVDMENLWNANMAPWKKWQD